MAKFSNDELLARYFALMTDPTSSDATLGAVVAEIERRGL